MEGERRGFEVGGWSSESCREVSERFRFRLVAGAIFVMREPQAGWFRFDTADCRNLLLEPKYQKVIRK